MNEEVADNNGQNTGRDTGSWWTPRRLAITITAGVAIALGLVIWGINTGAAPETKIAASERARATSSPSVSATSASPTPSASAPGNASPTAPIPSGAPRPPGDLVIPESCEGLYPPELYAQLQEHMPLNDPGNMLAISQDSRLETLRQELGPALECRWGAAGEMGSALGVSALRAGQEAPILERITALGSSCAPEGEGIRCKLTHTDSSEDMPKSAMMESAFIGRGIWINTVEVNFYPGDYLGAILSHLTS